MIDWKGADLSPEQDASIEKFQIVNGSGYSTPNDGALVDGKSCPQDLGIDFFRLYTFIQELNGFIYHIFCFVFSTFGR